MAEWARRWLDSTQHLKPKTRAGYESHLRSVIPPSLGSVQVQDLRPMQVRGWVASLVRRGYSPSRVRQAYRLLSLVLTAAQLDGLIVASPCAGVRLPKLPDHELTILTPQQVAGLADAVPQGYGLFVRFLAYTGLRFSEATAVAWPALDLLGKALVVSRSLSDADGVLSFVELKNHQHRRVTLPDALVEPLRARAALRTPLSPSLVLTSPEGMALRPQNFMRRAWSPTCAALHLDATPHDLRASHASWLFDLGWSPVEIAARLGTRTPASRRSTTPAGSPVGTSRSPTAWTGSPLHRCRQQKGSPPTEQGRHAQRIADREHGWPGIGWSPVNFAQRRVRGLKRR